MKTKILFFFLLLVVGVGNGLAQSTDSLLQKIQEARSLLANWDTIPGSDNDKHLAIAIRKPIQIKDSIRTVDDRWFGVLLEQQVYYNRHIYYDETNKLLKIESKFSQEKYNIGRCIFNLLDQGILLLILCYLTNSFYRKECKTLDWIAWCIVLGAFIYFSYYLGTLCGIISLLYIFKDKIKG